MLILGYTLEQWFALVQQCCVCTGLVSAQALAIRAAWQKVQKRTSKPGADRAE